MSHDMLTDPERVTVDRINAVVKEIREYAANREDGMATEIEMRLHVAVLGAVARGIIVGDVARDCANSALRTIELSFHRTTPEPKS